MDPVWLQAFRAPSRLRTAVGVRPLQKTPLLAHSASIAIGARRSFAHGRVRKQLGRAPTQCPSLGRRRSRSKARCRGVAPAAFVALEAHRRAPVFPRARGDPRSRRVRARPRARAYAVADRAPRRLNGLGRGVRAVAARDRRRRRSNPHSQDTKGRQRSGIVLRKVRVQGRPSWGLSSFARGSRNRRELQPATNVGVRGFLARSVC